MAVDFDQRVSIPKSVLMREVDDEAVLLNLANQFYYGLNGSGTRMLKTLQNSGSIKTALDILEAEYEVEPERLREDLTAFIQELIGHGMLELIDGP
jgi:hypothetical protein